MTHLDNTSGTPVSHTCPDMDTYLLISSPLSLAVPILSERTLYFYTVHNMLSSSTNMVQQHIKNKSIEILCAEILYYFGAVRLWVGRSFGEIHWHISKHYTYGALNVICPWAHMCARIGVIYCKSVFEFLYKKKTVSTFLTLSFTISNSCSLGG